MNEPNTASGKIPIIDPNERRWLERKAVQLARELKCPLPDALIAARCEFESLRTRPKAVVIPLVGRSHRGIRGPHEASN
jgi:hypothetical protein